MLKNKDKNIDDMSREELLDFIKSDMFNTARDEIIRGAIEDYFEQEEPPADIRKLKSCLIRHINKQIEMDNVRFGRTGSVSYKRIEKLTMDEFKYILPYLDDYKIVKQSRHADAETADLMYQTEHGWYEPAYSHVKKLCVTLDPSFKTSNTTEVVDQIKALIETVSDECHDPDYTPLLNGVFNKYHWDKHHELLPYTSDRIFINPFCVEFNPNATNPEIDIDGELFDIEDWLTELAANDGEIKDTLWDVLSAILHPYRKYRKALMVYSPVGNNGKGTFVELCRNVVGPNLCTDIAIEDFADKNLVVDIANARLVAGDENAVNQYIDNSENFKKAVTGDPITVDRKYKSSLKFSYSGFIIQCMNGLPTTKDKSNSFYRRLMVIPFNSNFEGKENTAIKNVYMKNKDVLEYVVYKALMRDVYELETPSAAEQLMEEYKEENDTLIQWWKDEGSQADYKWNRIPWCLLYSSYDWWYRENNKRDKCNLSSAKFSREFKQKILPDLDGWDIPDNADGSFSVTTEMKNTPEPLIGKYNCVALSNPAARGSKDDYKVGTFNNNWNKSYRGIIKVE